MEDKCPQCWDVWTYSRACSACNQHATQRAADAERERDEAAELLAKLASLAEWAGQTDNDDVVSARAFLSRLAQPKETKP